MPSKGSESELVPPTRWYRRRQQLWLNAPALRGVASGWLQHEGSLTRALQLRCKERFHVDVVQEGFARPTREEALTLQIPPHQLAWIREVRLCGDGEPWVLARTIIPLTTLKGDGQRLRHLGRTPLGAWLFSHRQWRRGPLQPGLCLSGSDAGPVCARRSVFHRNRCRLLVGEYFLPALLEAPGPEVEYTA